MIKGGRNRRLLCRKIYGWWRLLPNTGNNAAAARIAALAPTNADQAELAAQCVAARAQAEDLMRLIRLHAADVNLVVKLNAQCAAMFRASLAAHNRLLREQRRRREQPPADKSERTAQTAAPAALRPSPVPKTETKSQPSKNETPGRRPEPDPVAAIYR